MTTTMSSARFRINEPHVLHQTIDNEVVIINLDTGNYYSLLKSGADVWSALQYGAGISEIVGALVRKYGAAADAVAGPVKQLIERLQTEGLIEGYSDEASSPKPAGIAERVSALATATFEAPILEKYDDMQDLILLDPVHEVDDEKGWPHAKPPGKGGSKA